MHAHALFLSKTNQTAEPAAATAVAAAVEDDRRPRDSLQDDGAARPAYYTRDLRTLRCGDAAPRCAGRRSVHPHVSAAPTTIDDKRIGRWGAAWGTAGDAVLPCPSSTRRYPRPITARTVNGRSIQRGRSLCPSPIESTVGVMVEMEDGQLSRLG
jgi:hypothetical protein